ncbi:MAG: hypothetical protein IKW96_13770 [Ruminococcus sp.]|uniref:hypothetical protein n=1 Tax=Ruminococcus sp. TaxID=41978 RepID=UPI0025FE243B|nr:hypothetical protein [Ruminococcus sp.]MBR5684317.1 hypothetical protein [Ruminococcus sp.]
MQYLPIVQELFESNSLYIFLGGAVAALIVAALLTVLIKLSRKTKIILLCITAAIYVVCEAGLNITSKYSIGFPMFFIGTFSLGAFVGFLIAAVVSAIRNKKNNSDT